MRRRIPTALCLFSIITAHAQADMVTFENNGTLGPLSYYDPNFGSTILGQAMDITRDANAQPALGETPSGSIFFMRTKDFSGEFIWLGTGSVTRTARSTDPVLIYDPAVGQEVDFFGPQAFGTGDAVDSSSNFVDGWRAIHGFNDFTDKAGIFTVGASFTVGVEFQLDDQTHYGFVTFDRLYDFRSDETPNNTGVEVWLIPQFWGYNTTAGEAAYVVPAPAGSALLTAGLGLGFTRRRR